MTKSSQCSPDAMRRLFDLTCAGAGLVLLSPILALIALTILLSDGPPVFFRQTRVGRHGRPFSIWKFRTMRTCVRGSAITAAGDPRITKIGAMLRHHKLDELPQLINVLTGDMSVVGPRPEMAEYVELDAPIWRKVLQARPGITDLATLLSRDEENILVAGSDLEALYREHVLPTKLALNVSYLRSRSFSQDIKLILLTIRYSLFPGEFDPDSIKKAFHADALHA
jgi:lipopolysaccharide/colanic/teichoic acid biosynthesis glycosyltransferase